LLLSILLHLLHIDLDFCNSDMNAACDYYKTQRYTAKYHAMLHGEFHWKRSCLRRLPKKLSATALSQQFFIPSECLASIILPAFLDPSPKHGGSDFQVSSRFCYRKSLIQH